MNSLLHLPGGEQVARGLEDCQAGLLTPEACLVSIAHPNLLRAGIIVSHQPLPDAELQLYALLRQAGGDAYSSYNALIRQLVSFEQALARQGKNRESDP